MILARPIARRARRDDPCENETAERAAIDRRTALLGIVSLPLTTAAAPKQAGDPDFLELPVSRMRRVTPTLWIAPLADAVWITCFTGRIAQGWYPANGMIVADQRSVTVIDTGWDRQQGTALLKLAAEVAGKPVARGIATHFHSDRSGGIEAFRRAGVPVLAHPLTTGLARAHGAPEPDPLPGFEHGPVQLGGIELCHPGPGHAPDNIAAWHAASQTLFGGCLLKSVTSGDLGNLEDADVQAWGATLTRLAARYPARTHTIPGHGTIAGDAIAHSQGLLARQNGSG